MGAEKNSPVTHEDGVEYVLEDAARLELLHDDAPLVALGRHPLDVREELWAKKGVLASECPLRGNGPFRPLRPLHLTEGSSRT